MLQSYSNLNCGDTHSAHIIESSRLFQITPSFGFTTTTELFSARQSAAWPTLGGEGLATPDDASRHSEHTDVQQSITAEDPGTTTHVLYSGKFCRR